MYFGHFTTSVLKLPGVDPVLMAATIVEGAVLTNPRTLSTEKALTVAVLHRDNALVNSASKAGALSENSAR